MALSVVVERERSARDLSIRELSATTGIPLPTLSRRLNPNALSPFTASELERIANQFGMRPSDLFIAAEATAA